MTKNILALAAAGFITVGMMGTPAVAAAQAAPHMQPAATGSIELSARHYRGHYRHGYRYGYRPYGYRHYGYRYRPYYAYSPYYYGPRYRRAPFPFGFPFY